jgi:hypothetical protein
VAHSQGAKTPGDHDHDEQRYAKDPLSCLHNTVVLQLLLCWPSWPLLSPIEGWSARDAATIHDSVAGAPYLTLKYRGVTATSRAKARRVPSTPPSTRVGTRQEAR